MRKLTIALAIAVAASVLLLTPGLAFANFAIHGGYSMDTDACAGCHRAHTAASSITWTNDSDEQKSALLLGTADEVYEFCFTCHGSDASGAATNVEDGFYESDDYGTLGADLNGGGFGMAFTSTHTFNGSTWGAWGGGETGRDGIITTGYGEQIVMSCSSCHDVHGSANYRLLKDSVNGVRVGGYDPVPTPEDPTPTPFVVSNETGFPAGGWLLHEPGAAQVAGYTPNYTTPQYAKAPGEDPEKGISAWCRACHTQYMTTTGAVTEALYPDGTFDSSTQTATGFYDANDGYGFVTRHRHPVNTEMGNFDKAERGVIQPSRLPLATASTDTTWTDYWVDCLTCHVSHGTKATMSGFANVFDSTDPVPDSGSGGVDPTNSSALLRLDDRGVCQDCHNK
ncbi:MAG: cytochrome c3 family protein [Coriobacteriia bacterium]|nr:cytochrome c3 family protein [Coriobacteriia bacterium]